MHLCRMEDVAGHNPAALDQHSVLLEGLKVGRQLSTPTLQQRAQLVEGQHPSADQKVVHLQIAAAPSYGEWTGLST